jgi:ABC transport system ATP-binding/permease protein
VMLARALAKPSNVLVLDEPTNDLDLETLDVLEEMLGDYTGTVILISHDRDFLDRVVNAVIVPEGDGIWQEYAGGYSDMLAQRGADILSRQAERTKAKPEEKTSSLVRAVNPPKKRLGFNEKHALTTLPAHIAELEATITKLHSILHDPNLYVRDRQQFDKATAALTAAQNELAISEERWLELEMLREEIEG